jgi:hypothetical protein
MGGYSLCFPPDAGTAAQSVVLARRKQIVVAFMKTLCGGLFLFVKQRFRDSKRE